MYVSGPWELISAVFAAFFIRPLHGYYKLVQCFGTGECILQPNPGGQVDDIQRWAQECHDGEALMGFMGFASYTGLSQQWCKFQFPKKKPSNGFYPYYDFCNVRDLTIMHENYCFDKYYPVDTYDTFVTAYTSAAFYSRGIVTGLAASNNELYKCCRLPYGYHLDYTRCLYKYSHDKYGEHYDENTMFLMKCDRDHVMTGMGRAESPFDGYFHYVWIQCCPHFYDTTYIPLYMTANITLHLQAKPPPKLPPAKNGYAYARHVEDMRTGTMPSDMVL